MKSSTKFTKNIQEGTSGNINGKGDFINAYYTHKGSRDLYFYPKTGYSDSNVVNDLDSSEFTGTGIGGITSSISTPFETGTYRTGGYPRFIAEFLIVARE